MAISTRDILTYDGSKWVNQPWVAVTGINGAGFGVGAAPSYPFHVTSGPSGVFATSADTGGGTAVLGLVNASRQWSLRDFITTGRFAIRDDTAGVERVNIDSSGNVGIGTTSPGSLLQLAGPIATAITTSPKTGAYTLGASDSIVTGSASGGAFNLQLPSASGIAGRKYTLKKTDSSVNAVTVTTTSSQTIDGNATYALSAQWQFVTVVSDGSNWLIVAK